MTAIWHILSKNEPYNAELYRQSDIPPVVREFITEQAIAYMRTKGFHIIDEKTGEVV